MSKESFVSLFTKKNAELFTMTIDDNLAGCITLVGRRIYQLGIKKTYNGKGLGKVMVDNLAVVKNDLYITVGIDYPVVMKTVLNSEFCFCDDLKTLSKIITNVGKFYREKILNFDTLVFTKDQSSKPSQSKLHNQGYEQVLLMQRT